jgi:hypothetical protein
MREAPFPLIGEGTLGDPEDDHQPWVAQGVRVQERSRTELEVALSPTRTAPEAR